MHDKEIYHSSAVEYNRTLAEAAEKLVDVVEDPTVKKWCRGIGKQHRYHEKRHASALTKIQSEEPAPLTVAEEQKIFARERMADEAQEGSHDISDVDFRDAESGRYVTEEYAEGNPATTVAESSKEEE